MFETAQKYSEYKYYNKTDLEAEMEHYLVEPLWHEILQYRNFFKIKFPIRDRNTYLVRNPYVNDCIAKTQERMHTYMRNHANEQVSDVNCFWLKEEEVMMYQSFVCQLQHLTFYDHGKMIAYLLEHTTLASSISKHVLTYILEEHNLLLQLFLCAMECDKRSFYLLYYPILKNHGMLLIANAITSDEMMEIVMKKDENIDVTRRFLSFLSHIRLKLSTEMVSLDAYGKHNVCEMRSQELIEKFPMLSKEQILFYVEHREIHHFYTLQDYMKMHHCCYETARYSLEKLVSLKWYQKQKMGKKFVYFIL